MKALIIACLIVLLTFIPLANGANETATIEDANDLKGSVKVKRSGQENVIETVTLVQYLEGCCQAEIGAYILQANLADAKTVEAYKTQAVAAATYFMKHQPRNQAYDITDTTNDQAYTTFVAADFPKIAAAVTALYSVTDGVGSGKVLKYDGQLIDSVFFGHRNGQNLNSEDSAAFGGYSPYLREKFTDQVNATGAAQGHGVGLDQSGIKHFAADGKTYDAILKYYYQARPPYLVKLVVIQDKNANKSFDDAGEVVYTGERVNGTLTAGKDL